MIWNKEMECADRETMRAVQLERLQATVKYEYENVPYYAAKMDKAGVRPEDIQTLEDIELLPFITKEDLAENYPTGLQAAPMKDIVRIQSSSGTTGKPKIIGYTKGDMDDWAVIDLLKEKAGIPIPPAVEEIRNAEIRHKNECDPGEMEETVAKLLGL